MWTHWNAWRRSPLDSPARKTHRAGRWLEAEVASTAHHFAEARDHLAPQPPKRLHQSGPIERQLLAIDQACGIALDAGARYAPPDGQRRAGGSRNWYRSAQLLADLECFDEAEAVYRQAFSSYDDISPFPLAWVCFQLGMLWGELVQVPDPESRRALVSTRDRLLTGLCEGACAPSGDPREPRPNSAPRKRYSCKRFGAAIRRSVGGLADMLIAQGRFEEGREAA